MASQERNDAIKQVENVIANPPENGETTIKIFELAIKVNDGELLNRLIGVCKTIPNINHLVAFASLLKKDEALEILMAIRTLC